jgi:dTDP-4-amino-4,6-dideoxygalactose transaminase
LLRDHGSPAKYVHLIVGTNARLDAIQAAVLSVKLGHLPRWNARRAEHAKAYAARLRNPCIQIPEVPRSSEHNFHLFVIRVKNRDAVRHQLRDCGIETGIHYPLPLHLTPAYQEFGYPMRGSLPVSEALATEILSLPMYPELNDAQREEVSETVLASLNQVETGEVSVVEA